MSSSRVVKGILASGNFHPIQMNAVNETASDPVPGIPTAGVKSEVASSLPSVTSNGHFSFALEISGMSLQAVIIPKHPFVYTAIMTMKSKKAMTPSINTVSIEVT